MRRFPKLPLLGVTRRFDEESIHIPPSTTGAPCPRNSKADPRLTSEGLHWAVQLHAQPSLFCPPWSVHILFLVLDFLLLILATPLPILCIPTPLNVPPLPPEPPYPPSVLLF